MEKILNIVSHSPEQTLLLAEQLARTCFLDGDVLILSGPLGAGKTVFVRGLARGRDIDENSVNSPSFTFINEYPGEKPVFHFDLYRMGDNSELFEIGWQDYLLRPGLMVVEWGEKAESLLPEKYYQLTFDIISENEREIKVTIVTR